MNARYPEIHSVKVYNTKTLTISIVMAPHLHELVGRQLLQLSGVRVSELPHEVGSPFNIQPFGRRVRVKTHFESI